MVGGMGLQLLLSVYVCCLSRLLLLAAMRRRRFPTNQPY